jgi:hypothetical protein
MLFNQEFDLLLFSTDIEVINQAIQGGLNNIIVDLERRGKRSRQKGYDTQINKNNFIDIKNIKENTTARVISRINGFYKDTKQEINLAIDLGADEILLPMVKQLDEVAQSLTIVNNRCQLSIMIETQNAVNIITELAKYPILRFYVGLNDLAIDRGLSNLFIPLVDGTLTHIRNHISQPFGFGGLTVPSAGYPIPSRLLISENARLKSNFSILRRSFFRDTSHMDLSEGISKILSAVSNAFSKNEDELEKDHIELESLILNKDLKF